MITINMLWYDLPIIFSDRQTL